MKRKETLGHSCTSLSWSGAWGQDVEPDKGRRWSLLCIEHLLSDLSLISQEFLQGAPLRPVTEAETTQRRELPQGHGTRKGLESKPHLASLPTTPCFQLSPFLTPNATHLVIQQRCTEPLPSARGWASSRQYIARVLLSVLWRRGGTLSIPP